MTWLAPGGSTRPASHRCDLEPPSTSVRTGLRRTIGDRLTPVRAGLAPDRSGPPRRSRSTPMTTTPTTRPVSGSRAMGAELRAETEAGAAMVATAASMSGEFAAAALVHDRDGTFAAAHLARLRDDGFLHAPVPGELGGGGVRSVHDVLVAMSRLAQGDAATSIGVNMHFAVLLNVVRRWRVATARGDAQQASELGAMLRTITEGRIVFAAAVSEPAPQDLTRPATCAERVEA